MALSVRWFLFHVDVGGQKAQELQEGVWRQISEEEHPLPVHLLRCLASTLNLQSCISNHLPVALQIGSSKPNRLISLVM